MTKKHNTRGVRSTRAGEGARRDAFDKDALLSALCETIESGNCVRWPLQDAKSQFSEVVQRALEGNPQCVTKHGKDAVIVISYDSLLKVVRPKQNLFDFFRSSPLVGADLDLQRLPGAIREVDL
ncbi:MAG TPA: type II toxin-antitoxin system Phd/YefM family antitoxin [Candidatus Baltobacteraceae bacterium]|nr:type II toxin-antitoxin system Phd/YefM family antitoxin [Candidatus Baltobacteraceae bacterium]